ncbi:MAG: glycosyltransferase family 2 protein [Deltaproteobacteria bacterium]|nr:glycosyltransferase family 2 protein [Deltaproteobacteria bacterium]
MLSVTIITQNEEKNLRSCLESVAFADEIIILDSESQDRTLSIAREFTDKIFQEPWQGFARQKNMAQDKAQGPWILNIDADERVTTELKEEIVSAIQKGSLYTGFKIPRKNFFCGQWIRHGGWYPNYQLRLYQKEAGSFAQREVHEQVVVKGKVGTLKAPLEHYTYDSISDYLKRMDRYSDLSARQYLQEGKKVSWPEILFRTKYTFFKMWILQKGFLDGAKGLVLAILYSYYTFVKYAKLKEISN